MDIRLPLIAALALVLTVACTTGETLQVCDADGCRGKYTGHETEEPADKK